MKTKTLSIALAITGILNLPSNLDVSTTQNKEFKTQPRLEERIDLRTGGKIIVEESKLKDYNEWTDLAINWSRRNRDYAVIVNKLERKLFVYYNGTAIDSFLVGLSPRPIGEKSYEGDFLTPEGYYNIYDKNPRGSYHKSLKLNYPNPADRLRFQEDKRKGIIPNGKGSGSRIVIHGGGSEKDWTLGCIALDNEDMDRLFYLAKFGTPVVIRGY